MPDQPRRCRTVLVVEDDPDIVEAFRVALESEGYEVVTAENGERALEALDRVVGPCLILLDLFMPVMDGHEFLRRLRSEKHVVAAIPVVVVSAAGDRVIASVTGVDGYMKKPVDLDLLLGTVARYCDARGDGA